MSSELNGVINLFKTPGISSQSAVTRVKRLLGVRRAGHSGTLDPAACGVLPVLIGRATKMAQYLLEKEKEYIAELTLGIATDTLDSFGSITATGPDSMPEKDLRAHLGRFTGTLMQEPPAYSAVKLNGKALYRYAREGIEVKKPPREIVVRNLELLSSSDNRFLFHICCSKGTYVRTLLTDLAVACGTVGYVSFLERIRTGTFIVEDAVTLAELEVACREGTLNNVVTPPDSLGIGAPLVVPRYLYDILLSGSPIELKKVPGLHTKENVLYSIYCADEFFGLGTASHEALKLSVRIKIADSKKGG